MIRLKITNKFHYSLSLVISLICFFVMCFFITPIGFAKEPSSVEKIKAVYLYRIFQFVTWPGDSPKNTITKRTICVFESSEVTKTIRSLSKSKMYQPDVQVSLIDDVKKISHCHMLYIEGVFAGNLDNIFDALKKSPVLVISDNEKIFKHGGMIEFFTIDNKLKLNINLTRIKAVNISVSAKLLRLANEVIDNE